MRLWWLGVALVAALLAWHSTGDEGGQVARVIDGDTFALATGDRVRVLGLSACEASDPAGPAATEQARSLLAGQTVTLTAEPGVDRDRYGRLLRYVALGDGRDFATIMVSETHSGVYEGGDANPSYVESLRRADPNGRACG